MNLFKIIIGKFSKKPTEDGAHINPVEFKKVEGVEYRFAFESGGIKTYEPVDKQNIPYMRGMECQDIYDQLQRRVDEKYLKEWIKTYHAAVNSGDKIKLTDITKLVFLLEQRMEHVTNVELCYRLASVVFLDENENPLSYNPEYGTEKINRWKKDNSDAHAFFLRTQFNKFLPSWSMLGIDSPLYIQQEKKELNLHYRTFFNLQGAKD